MNFQRVFVWSRSLHGLSFCVVSKFFRICQSFDPIAAPRSKFPHTLFLGRFRPFKNSKKEEWLSFHFVASFSVVSDRICCLNRKQKCTNGSFGHYRGDATGAHRRLRGLAVTAHIGDSKWQMVKIQVCLHRKENCRCFFKLTYNQGKLPDTFPWF